MDILLTDTIDNIVFQPLDHDGIMYRKYSVTIFHDKNENASENILLEMCSYIDPEIANGQTSVDC